MDSEHLPFMVILTPKTGTQVGKACTTFHLALPASSTIDRHGAETPWAKSQSVGQSCSATTLCAIERISILNYPR